MTHSFDEELLPSAESAMQDNPAEGRKAAGRIHFFSSRGVFRL
jgi:hypothetical protein